MVVTCYKQGHMYVFSVHLDETKLLGNGAPDPNWIVEYTWPEEPPEGQTLNEYLTTCKRESLLLAEVELASRQPAQEIVLP